MKEVLPWIVTFAFIVLPAATFWFVLFTYDLVKKLARVIHEIRDAIDSISASSDGIYYESERGVHEDVEHEDSKLEPIMTDPSQLAEANRLRREQCDAAQQGEAPETIDKDLF